MDIFDIWDAVRKYGFLVASVLLIGFGVFTLYETISLLPPTDALSMTQFGLNVILMFLLFPLARFFFLKPTLAMKGVLPCLFYGIKKRRLL